MFSKKAPEAIEEEQTPVWACASADCRGWMRVNFVFHDEPNCPLCGSSMHPDSRMLPVLVNTTKSMAYN
jgi:hypothetical protein